jgi:FkbM family methyltransferase
MTMEIDINIVKQISTPINLSTSLDSIKEANISNYHHYYYSIFKFNKILNNIPIDLDLTEEVINCENFSFVTLKNDNCISDSLRRGILFEKFLMAFISKLIPCNSNVMDIGANIGVWSLAYSTFINGTIYAFEPQPKIYNCLRKSIRINNCTNIIPYNLALSDINCNYLMEVNYDIKSNFGGACISKHGTLEVKSQIGDDLDLSVVGFIKIDVEGHELEVINGLKNTIQRNKPIILIEIHSSHPNSNKTFKRIVEFGYSYVIKLSHCDYLFFN